VRYSVGPTNITPRVTAGTYVTPSLGSGASRVVKVVVTVRATAPAGSSLAATLTARSASDLTVKDTVKFVTRRA